jgi:hypothetical protein
MRAPRERRAARMLKRRYEIAEEARAHEKKWADIRKEFRALAAPIPPSPTEFTFINMDTDEIRERVQAALGLEDQPGEELNLAVDPARTPWWRRGRRNGTR